MKSKRLILLTLLALMLTDILQAATRRYRCIWNNDPATTMTIGFDQYDDGGVFGGNPSAPVLYYDVVDQGTNEAAYANSKGVDRMQSHKGMDNNFVRLTGLQPNTRYYFIIKDDQNTSPVLFFETAPDLPTDRLAIIAGGDSRDIPILDDDIGRQNANKLVAKLRAHGILFGGDMTWSDDATSPIDADEWPEWMDDWQLTISEDGRMTPIIPARGNHELSNNSIYHFFDTPNADNYYALSLGGDLLRTITLNTEISRLGDQLTWLENEASTSCAIWKVAQYHRPTRPHESGKDEQDDQADYWSPLFEEHGVQLVLESDAHLCKYTYPLLRSDATANVEGFIRDDENGVVYVGEGGWGAELRTVDDAKSWTMAHATFNQFKWLFIDQNTIEIRTVITDNADDVVAKTDADSKFSIPDNLDIWQASPSDNPSGILSYNDGVLTLNNPNSTELSLDLGPDVEIPTGGIISLDAGENFDAYLWSTGEDASGIMVANAGTYSVTVTLNGCTTTDEIMVTASPVNTESMGAITTFSVAPNPVSQRLVAYIEHRAATEPVDIYLLSPKGDTILHNKIELNQGFNSAEFDLTGFEPGVYFMALEQNGIKTVRKFLVAR